MRFLPWAAALLAALLLILSIPRFDIAWLAPFALTPLLVVITREPRPERRFLLGYVTGVVYWFGVCYWIQFVLAFHGGVGDVLGWALFFLFCLAKAIHMGVFGALAGVLMRSAWAVPTVAALWVAIEITHGPLGFAWFALGNSGIDMGIPLRVAPYAGVYGLSFLFAMMAAALALAFLKRPRVEMLPLTAVALVVFLPRLPDAQKGREVAVLVQPNLSPTEQWTPESVDRMLRRSVVLSLQGVVAGDGRPPAILAWPEVPAPLYYDQDPRFRAYVNDLARVSRTSFLLGVVGHAPDGAPLNSAMLVSPAGEPVSRYDKIHLVPFGEFVPWPFGFANKISTEIGDFRAGNRVVVSSAGSHSIGTFICYESVFPYLVRKFPAAGAEVLFNLSNDGWFGKSAAREQHLKIVRMRAAENRRWILRATNNGITASIDAAGRLRGTVPQFVEAASRLPYNYVQETTFYTRHGDWFAFACAIGAALELLRLTLAGRHS